MQLGMLWNHNKPSGIPHQNNEKVGISDICHEQIDANLTVAGSRLCNESV